MTFSEDSVLDPDVTFSAPGDYDLQLTVFTSAGPVTDEVTITVDPVVVSYCTGKTTSLGQVPYMTTTGEPSVTATSPFRVQGNDFVPNEHGYLLYAFGKSNLDFHGGKLCVKPATMQKVFPVKQARPDGTIFRNFNKTIQSGNIPLLTAGRKVYLQWYESDPGNPSGFNDALSDAVRFTIGP